MGKISYGVAFCGALAVLLGFETTVYAAGDTLQTASQDSEEAFTERKDLREERVAIRADHEALDAEREKLKTQCMDAKGQDRTACDAAWGKLRAKRQVLAERVKALHEKMRNEKHARASETGETLTVSTPKSVDRPMSASVTK